MFDESVHNGLKQKNKIFALCVVAFAAVFTAARMVLTRFFIHEQAHFYTEKAGALVYSVDYLIAACVILIYFVSFFAYKRRRESHNYEEVAECLVQGTQGQVFSAFLAGFLFVASSVFWLYSLFNPATGPKFSEDLPFLRQVWGYIKEYPFDVLIFFASILSAVYFFKTASFSFDAENAGASAKYSTAYAIFSFMPIFWSFFNIFKCFFDMSKNVNSPVRIYELMGYLAFLAYFVSESRILVGRRQTSKFFTFAYISVILVTASALPNLVWSSFWILSTNNEQILYATQLAIVTYIFSRIYSQVKYGRVLLQR